MSEIKKKSQTVEDIEFLNSEVGRLNAVKTLLETDIEDIEVQKATKQKEFDANVAQKLLQIDRLEKSVEMSNLQLISLNSEIGSKELILEDKRKELDFSNTKLKENEEDGVELSKLLEGRRETAQVAEEKAKLAIKELEVKQKLNDVREKDLDNKESSIVGTTKTLEADIEQNKKLKISLEKQLVEVEEQKRTLATNKFVVENLQKDFNEKLSKQKLQNEEFFSLQKRAEAIEVALYQKLKDVKIIEDELAKQKSVLASREADVILKERECKIREKTLSIKEREKQLNDQPIASN